MKIKQNIEEYSLTEDFFSAYEIKQMAVEKYIYVIQYFRSLS